MNIYAVVPKVHGGSGRRVAAAPCGTQTASRRRNCAIIPAGQLAQPPDSWMRNFYLCGFCYARRRTTQGGSRIAVGKPRRGVPHCGNSSGRRVRRLHRKPQAASRKPQAASRKPQAASNYEENARRVKYFLPNSHFFYPVLSTPRRRSIESAQQVYQKEFLLSCALTHKNAENRQISKNFSACCGRCLPFMRGRRMKGAGGRRNKKINFFPKNLRKKNFLDKV